MGKTYLGPLGGVMVLALLLAPLFVWFFCRIEPRNGQIAVMIKKTGKQLPSEQILAPGPEYKGIQLDVLGEGRYFRNPYVWEWEITAITDIPAGHFGVLVRKYGKDLPEGDIIAPSAEYKGIVKDVLGTGKHRINPYAYDVEVYEDLRIMPGTVGVVVNVCGADVFAGVANDITNSKGFLVDSSRKGVLAEVLKEGTHRINPFLQSVSIVNIQSQRYEFSGDDAIVFITMDGFNISLEGTVEFNLSAESAPCLSHEVGDMEDILKKLILPSVSGFARIEGSKKTATEFIVGESRQLFQNELEKFLQANCRTWGISINSVLIRDIIPPQDIAEIIRNRELAQQEAKKYKQQIEQAKSATVLEEQRTLALQRKAIVAAETQKLTSEIAAKQSQVEKVIDAQTKLDAASIEYQRAEADTKAMLTIAEAERNVISARNTMERDVLKLNIAAFGGAEAYVAGLLYERVAPQIQSVLSQAGPGPFGLPVGLQPKTPPKGGTQP